jgi:ADP-heptose:LPS heptosyltransferase
MSEEKRLLIIRSASFQQLDQNLPEILKAFPGYSIHMLTHAHGLEAASKYSSIDKIYTYPYKDSFSRKRKPPEEMKSRSFDVVIVPVSNRTGAGFLNVQLFSLTIKAKKRYLCNMISEFKEILPGFLIAKYVQNKLFSILALMLTFLISIPILLLIPWRLKRLEK